jgi:redox-sensitive bicupin YhaK (pirin superfamily)
MDQIRNVAKIVTGKNAVDGAGVKLVRVFGHKETEEFDPFLMLDAFDSTNPDDYVKGFPWHPHRGIETITYLIAGEIIHGDSLGNKGIISDGECQWMTAGSGIIHQEMPQPADRMYGVQLWLNIPAEHKMTAPKYNGKTQREIPVAEDKNAIVHIISGSYNGAKGAIEGDFVKPLYLDVDLKPGASWSVKTAKDETLFVYILEGTGFFGNDDKNRIGSKRAVLFDSGTKFIVQSGDKGIRFLLLNGKPLKEPIAWGGPIVMNTQEELETAFNELEAHTFIK